MTGRNQFINLMLTQNVRAISTLKAQLIILIFNCLQPELPFPALYFSRMPAG